MRHTPRISAIKTTSIIVLTIHFDYIIKVNSIKIVIETIVMLRKHQTTMPIEYDLLILARNLYYAINFLHSINFDSLNYNSKHYFIKIVLINYYNISSKDNYYSRLIIIKANLRIRLKLLRLIKINYLKISINLYY